MPEKLEEIMKKIHVLLADCEQISYSSEEIIVPKKKLFALLEQLNYVVYEIMEQYEMTLAARNRAILQEEQKAREIQKKAKQNAEDMYAASLVYTEDILNDLKIVTDMMYQKIEVEYEEVLQKIKTEYEEALQNHKRRMKYLRRTEDEVLLQINAMTDAKMYVKLIEERRKEKEAAIEREEARKKADKKKELDIETVNIEENESQTEEEAEAKSNELESAKSEQQVSTEQPPAKPRECVGEVIDEEMDEYAVKLSSQPVITVHERPQVPEGFTKKKDKRVAKVKPEIPNEEIEISPDEIVDYNEIPEMPQFSTEDLDREYFEWQENKEQTGEKIEQRKIKGQKLLARWKK